MDQIMVYQEENSMNKGTKIVLFTGLGILIVGVLLGVIAFALSGFRFRGNPFAATETSAAVKTIELEFNEDFANVDISVPSAEVTVLPSKDKIARIEYTAQQDELDYEAYVKDNTLVFRRPDNAADMDWATPTQIMENITNLISTGNFLEKQLTLYLPKKAYEKLEISTASGDILSEQDFSFKEASLASVSGEITLSNLKNAESVSLKATSGSIRAANMDVKSFFEVLTVSGDSQLDSIKVSGKLMAAATSGEIRLRDASFSDTEIETISGDVSLENVTSKTLSATTVSGEVTGRVDATIDVHASSVSGEIRVPGGSGDKWYINTTSGDINLHS